MGSRIELELLRPGATQTTAVTLTRQPLVQAGPATPQRAAAKPPVEQQQQAPRQAASPAGGVGFWGKSPAKSHPSADGGMKISAPFNFQHKVHVQADPTAPNGFRGLPPGWAQQLEAAGISQEDAAANGEAIIDVLRFHMEAGGAPAAHTRIASSATAKKRMESSHNGGAPRFGR